MVNVPSTPVWGGAFSRFSHVWCDVEDTPRWVGTPGQHATESGTSGDLELVCNEAVGP